MSVVSKTVLGLAAAAAMIFVSAGTASAQCPYGGGGYGYGGGFGGGYGRGAVVSIGIGGNRGYGGYGGYGGGYAVRNTYRPPVYHAPSVHLDRVYHPTRVHWTPRRGVHTHGHYDLVPHHVPGHFH